MHDMPERGVGRRRARLPRGGTLVIRPVDAGDVDGLAALFAGLDTDSVYRRFFSIYRPNRAFFERMAAVAERGGAELVAEVTDPPHEGGRIVGEAGYELLENGDGELAITVERTWRGWLGPYLLDALVETAAARGVPNLEADILVTNGPMLALLRARGHAVMPTGDWTVLRAMIGTTTPTPTWPGGGRKGLRVLVEGAGHWHAEDGAKAVGLQVVGCPGPVGRHPRCPALAGEPCPLAAGADAIVVTHPPDTDAWQAVRAAHPHLHPGVPVCIELPRGGGDAAPGETPAPLRGDLDVVALVQRLAQDRHPPGEPPSSPEDTAGGPPSS